MGILHQSVTLLQSDLI